MRPGSGNGLLLVLMLSGCSFHSEPLLVGQRSEVGDDESGASAGAGRGPTQHDAGPPSGSLAGSGGSTAQDAGTIQPEPARDAAMIVDARTTEPEKDAGPPAMDATVEDTAVPPDPPAEDAAPDPEPDSGPPPECPCTCPHELVSLDPNRDPRCTLTACAIADCAPEPTCTFEAHGKSGYYFCPDGHTWEAAKTHCAEVESTHLVSIESQGEDDFLFDQLADSDKTWTGGNDQRREGDFEWQGGMVFWRGGAPGIDIPGGGGPGGGPGPGGDDSGGEPVDGAYTNFLSYEPNDQGLDNQPGDCVLTWTDQDAWADASCDDEHGYVCEFPIP